MKTICRILSFVVLLGMTAGMTCCNSRSSPGVASTVDYSRASPLTIDFYSAEANYQGIQGGWFAKILKDKFNMTVNIIAPNVTGGGDTLYQTRSAAGNLGDLLCIDSAKFKDCVNSGLVLDISNYLSGKMNLDKIKPAMDSVKKFLNTKNVYGIRTVASHNSATTPALNDVNPFYGTYMRYDYYTELGSPKINNTDDLLTVLKKMQEKHPKSDSGKKTYAFSLWKDWYGGNLSLAAKFSYVFGMSEAVDFMFANKEATKTEVITDDNSSYYQALKFYFKANQMGLLDPDSSSQSFNTVLEKDHDGACLFSWFNWERWQWNTIARGNKGQGFAFIPVKGEHIIQDGCDPYGSGIIMGVGSKAKDPERMVSFIDWLASPESVNYINNGIEGLNYIRKNGKNVLTKYGLTPTASNVPKRYGGGTYNYGKCQFNVNMLSPSDTDPNTNEPYSSPLWSSSENSFRTKLDNSWSKAFHAKNSVEYLEKNKQLEVVPGTSYFAPETSSDIQNEITQCGTVIKLTSWKMIFAYNETEFNRLWKSMQAQLKGLGYDDVIKYEKQKLEDIRIARAEAIRNSK